MDPFPWDRGERVPGCTLGYHGSPMHSSLRTREPESWENVTVIMSPGETLGCGQSSAGEVSEGEKYVGL